MKCVIPEVAYHNRDPVLSIDFQCKAQPGDPLRLATGGSDSHVVIWNVREGEEGKVEFDCLSDLVRHQRAVNIVRWSPDGSLLASGDDESVIIVWQLKPSASDGGGLFEEGGAENLENWVVYKMLRFHLDDVYDLAWSPCSQFLLSGSVDNTAIISNVHKNQKVGHLSESQGFVQGVAWNPRHATLATLSSDRKLRVYSSTTRKLMAKVHKANLAIQALRPTARRKKTTAPSQPEANGPSHPEANGPCQPEDIASSQPEAANSKSEAVKTDNNDPVESAAAENDRSSQAGEEKSEERPVRLFHDDTFKGFFRRLAWSIDGELLVAPSGVVETDTEARLTHCSYVFSRCDLSKPALYLPTQDKYTIAVRFCPVFFKLRPIKRKNVPKPQDPRAQPWEIYQTAFCLPYRMVYAVATQNAVMLYDTQQIAPFGRVCNIHYAGLTDLAWSPDGKILFVSSCDGFCSIITFSEGELGEVLGTDHQASATREAEEPSSGTGSNVQEEEEEAVAGGMEVEEAGSTELSLVLEETQIEAPVEMKPKKRAPLISLPPATNQPASDKAEQGKGRRVSLITLSSPRPKQNS